MKPLLATLAVMALWIVPLYAMGHLAGVARSWFHGRNRRNPLTSGLLRPPGHTLREQLDEVRLDMMAYSSIGSGMPLLMAAVYLAQGSAGTAPEQYWWGYVLMGLGIFLFSSFKIVRLVERARNLRLGFEAESAVGEELNLLMKDGFSIFHDVPGDRAFNVDHVVVGPTGVFAVETKGRAKLATKGDKSAYTVELRDNGLVFSDWTTSEPLDQARRNSQWLAKWLSSAVGQTINAKPVVVLPGWFVELKAKSDVAVLNAKQCRGYFPKAKAMHLGPKLIQQIAHQLDARCRDVEPTTYKPLTD